MRSNESSGQKLLDSGVKSPVARMLAFLKNLCDTKALNSWDCQRAELSTALDEESWCAGTLINDSANIVDEIVAYCCLKFVFFTRIN